MPKNKIFANLVNETKIKGYILHTGTINQNNRHSITHPHPGVAGVSKVAKTNLNLYDFLCCYFSKYDHLLNVI